MKRSKQDELLIKIAKNGKRSTLKLQRWCESWTWWKVVIQLIEKNLEPPT